MEAGGTAGPLGDPSAPGWADAVAPGDAAPEAVGARADPVGRASRSLHAAATTEAAEAAETARNARRVTPSVTGGRPAWRAAGADGTIRARLPPRSASEDP
jgi:hypothetical protein